MTRQELLKRIEELERRVAMLEARPVYVPVPMYPTLPSLPLVPWSGPFAPYTTSGTPTIC